MKNIEVIDNLDFYSVIKNEEDLVIVSFYTNRCPNCKTLDSILVDILEDNELNVFKIDAEENIDLAKENKILGVPTTFFFRHGFLLDKKMGVKSKTSLLKSIEYFEKFSKEEAEVYSKKSFLSKLFGKS